MLTHLNKHLFFFLRTYYGELLRIQVILLYYPRHFSLLTPLDLCGKDNITFSLGSILCSSSWVYRKRTFSSLPWSYFETYIWSRTSRGKWCVISMLRVCELFILALTLFWCLIFRIETAWTLGPLFRVSILWVPQPTECEKKRNLWRAIVIWGVGSLLQHL